LKTVKLLVIVTNRQLSSRQLSSQPSYRHMTDINFHHDDV